MHRAFWLYWFGDPSVDYEACPDGIITLTAVSSAIQALRAHPRGDHDPPELRKINVHTLVDETAQNVEINECVDRALKLLDT
jgi:hypothetical protein